MFPFLLSALSHLSVSLPSGETLTERRPSLSFFYCQLVHFSIRRFDSTRLESDWTGLDWTLEIARRPRRLHLHVDLHRFRPSVSTHLLCSDRLFFRYSWLHLRCPPVFGFSLPFPCLRGLSRHFSAPLWSLCMYVYIICSGSIVRCMARLEETCRDIKNAARLPAPNRPTAGWLFVTNSANRRHLAALGS